VKPRLRNSFYWKLGLLVTSIVLFVLSFVFNKIYTNKSSVAVEARLAENYVHRHQEDFKAFLKDTALISKLVANKESQQEFERIISKRYGIFLYTVDNEGILALNFWSTQLVLPPPASYAEGNFEAYMDLMNGSYIVVKQLLDLNNRTIVAYAMIPIQSDFFLDTDNLPEEYVFSNTADARIDISTEKTPYAIKSITDKPLFYLERKSFGAVPYNSGLTLLLRLGGIAVLLLLIHLIAETLSRRRKEWHGILFLGLSLIIFRVITYLFPSLLHLRQFELFDPTIYGSNVIQRSLGDLLVNSMFFCWFVLFTWSKLQSMQDIVLKFPLWAKWAAGIVSLCLLIYSTFILSSVIRSMVADSKISFDVTDFFSLTVYTVIGFIVLACLALSYYYFTQLLFRIIFPLFRDNTWPIYFAIGFAGLIYLTVKSGDPTVLFYIPVLAWLLLYTWLVNRRGLILYNIRINIAGILFWIFVFSVSMSGIMLSENKKAEWAKRKTYAEKLAIETDPSSERLMNIAIQYLDDDFLSDNFYRFADSMRSKTLRDSIITGNYRAYVNKYDTKLYLYDSLGNPLYNEDAVSYDALKMIVTAQAKETGTEDLYYYGSSFDKFTYITHREIIDTNTNRLLGTFVMLSNPKKYSSDALFPVLFKEHAKNDPENSPIYSYAVYSAKRLIALSNKYPFPTKLVSAQEPREEFERRINGDYDELWYRAGNEKVVVMVRKRDTMIESITLFSYIFCSFLFLVTVVQLISLILKTGYNWKGFRRLFQINIRSQVHSTIIFISIFSFLVIGIATISFFISRYHRTNSDKLSRTMRIMVNEMQKEIGAHHTFDDVIRVYDSVAYGGLQELVDEVSDIHGVDVNVYDLNGDLKVSSDPTVYTKGVLSTKMDPTAYYHLDRLSKVQHVQNEKIANFSYLSIYAPVQDDKGEVYAYLSIPYFTSQQELNQEISNFIVTVINLNAFIFLIAGLIALFITNRITRSFSLISEKMRDVNLGRLNEEISWNRNDEIGELVKEYNKMVNKLGESATALAKTEREGAWREMARQVAHEIKNPLTPMKLSIQYLQKSIDSNQPNVKELSSNVATTLVEQIDHLAKIAADFSQFANIGNTNVEKFDLHNVIGSLKELFQPNENVEIDWQPVHQRIEVMADRTQMNRLFTNLFANAIEACPEKKCRLTVREQIVGNMIRISIGDNGEGIAPEMQSRIFVPNFTTKSSGTGLGLAMCKGIVEQSKGNIWFETERGVGTTFHVEIPVS
jgi:signal transduction histidine kinase